MILQWGRGGLAEAGGGKGLGQPIGPCRPTKCVVPGPGPALGPASRGSWVRTLPHAVPQAMARTLSCNPPQPYEEEAMALLALHVT